MKFLCVIFGLLAISSLVKSQNEDCSEEEFTCESTGMCIPDSWVCDGENDCPDLGDEQNCTISPTTVPCSGFVCPETGRCIPRPWVCDGDNDCGDLSDEEGCSLTSTTPCAGFKCPSGRCIPSRFICDGEDDCGDMSDEQDCSTTSTTPSTPCPFTCSNSGRCIPAGFVCDGDNDCGDWSDESEEECPCADGEIRCPRPPGSEFPGGCIPPEYICDEEGIWDCPDGFDEVNCTRTTQMIDSNQSSKQHHFSIRMETRKKTQHFKKQYQGKSRSQ